MHEVASRICSVTQNEIPGVNKTANTCVIGDGKLQHDEKMMAGLCRNIKT